PAGRARSGPAAAPQARPAAGEPSRADLPAAARSGHRAGRNRNRRAAWDGGEGHAGPVTSSRGLSGSLQGGLQLGPSRLVASVERLFPPIEIGAGALQRRSLAIV